MKAWRIEKHGGPEVLKLTEAPTPEPGPMQVRIRVQAIGVNHLDVWVRKGVPGHKFPLPMIPGCDVSGEIDSFGAGAEAALQKSDLKKGSPVIVNSALSCDRCEACLSGNQFLCAEFGILGETQDGGAAEYVIVPVSNLIPRPSSMTAAEAAALPVPYVTAWSMLTRKVNLRPGELILIHAGGSGVSVAAIQMAKTLGAVVITTVGSAEKAAKVKALGADHVINYRDSNFIQELKKITPQYHKKGVDVVVDHVGSDTLNDSLKALVRGGRLVTCGATSGAEVAINLKLIFFKNLSIHGSTMGSKADLMEVVDLIAQGKLKVVVDRELPFEKYPNALDLLENRQIFGKVVVTGLR